MEQKPGWTYRYCDSLEQQIAINDETGILYTEDKTRYSAEEAMIIIQHNYDLPKAVHIIKKVFNGTLVSL